MSLNCRFINCQSAPDLHYISLTHPLSGQYPAPTYSVPTISTTTHPTRNALHRQILTKCRSYVPHAPYAPLASSAPRTPPPPPPPSAPLPPDPPTATSQHPQSTHPPPVRTKTTTTRPPAGCGASRRARNTRKKGGKTYGFGGSLGVWGWGSWLMLISQILRELCLLILLGFGWGGTGWDSAC